MTAEEILADRTLTVSCNQALRECEKHGASFSEFISDHPSLKHETRVNASALLEWLGY